METISKPIFGVCVCRSAHYLTCSGICMLVSIIEISVRWYFVCVTSLLLLINAKMAGDVILHNWNINFFFAFLWKLCAFCSIASPNTSNSSNFTWSDHFDLCHEKFKMSLRSLKVLQIYTTDIQHKMRWEHCIGMTQHGKKNSEQTSNNSNNKIDP